MSADGRPVWNLGKFQFAADDRAPDTVNPSLWRQLRLTASLSAETAKAGLDLYREHRGERPIVAVIYTHSHVDHFGGVRGVVDETDVAAGRVRVIAPEHLGEEAVSENVFAGNHVSRRASYM
jgi:alkyl sulfatase BDS1-like metallo-beta-lactamase superfamily hydrolase